MGGPALERDFLNIDEESANIMWLQAHGWLGTDGQPTEKYNNFAAMTPEDLAAFGALLGGEESRVAAECYGKSHVQRGTGPGELKKGECLHQKARALIKRELW